MTRQIGMVGGLVLLLSGGVWAQSVKPKEEKPMVAEAAKVARGEAVNGLALRLAAARTEYQPGEALQLRLFLDNVGEKPLVVLRRTTHVDVGWHKANDATGRFILPGGLPPAPPPPLKPEDLTTLGPGQSLELADLELLGRINQEIKAGRGQAGRFTFVAWYSASADGGWGVRNLDKNAWAGVLRSNAVEIEVCGKKLAAPAEKKAEEITFTGRLIRYKQNEPQATVYAAVLHGLPPRARRDLGACPSTTSLPTKARASRAMARW